ncbi:hypothetical protein [Clavibacter zhangzhiyongii]|nr:hypothetical protein [Clavibacter zhangzhiyongii]
MPVTARVTFGRRHLLSELTPEDTDLKPDPDLTVFAEQLRADNY